MAARAAREADPGSQLEQLQAALASGDLPRGIVLKGEERYFREQGIAIVCAAASARGLELCRHDAHDPDFDARALCSDLSAPPMFAGARLVVVRHANALVKKEKHDDDEEEQGAAVAPAAVRAILSFLADQGTAGTLVIDAESLRADHAISKAITALGGPIVTCRRLWDSPAPWGDPDPRRVELVQWLLARAREKGVPLLPEKAVYVAEAIGNDLSALDGELERLRRRGAQGVEDAVVWTSGASPFAVAEHLVRGDLAPALAGIEGLFRAGTRGRDGSREVDPAALLAMLFGSVRNKLRHSLAHAEGTAAGGLAPRARAELEERARLRPARAWRRLQDELAELERRARSGAVVDASDLALLALRWRAPQRASAVRKR